MAKNFLGSGDLWLSSFFYLSSFILTREAPGILFPHLLILICLWLKIIFIPKWHILVPFNFPLKLSSLRAELSLISVRTVPGRQQLFRQMFVELMNIAYQLLCPSTHMGLLRFILNYSTSEDFLEKSWCRQQIVWSALLLMVKIHVS